LAQSKYKRHSRGGRFRQQGEGSRAAVDEIRRQRQTEIDALKTQALQQKERDSLQISGIRNVAKSEAENRNILHELENKIYQNKRNAITVRSQTEVDSLLGQAKELGREAEFWEEFATKHSKELGSLAGNLYNYAQYRAAIKAYESQSEKEKDSAEALHESSYDIVKREGDEAVIEIEDLSQKKDTIKSVSGFANNAHYQKMKQKDFFETLNSHIDLAKGYTAEDGTVLFTKDTATQIILNLGYNYCLTHDIPLNSAAGRKIMSKLKQQAVIETAKLTKSHNYKIDDAGLRELAKVAATHYMNIDEPAYRINKAGEKVYEDDSIGSDTFPGEVLITSDGTFKVAGGKERFHDSLYDLYTAYKGSYTLGTNGILAPGDPARLAETPKHVWAEVLKRVINSTNFKTKADAIHYLNIPVRDKNGKIVYKKDGVTPAEFLLDKLPDLKEEVEDHWDKMNNKSVTEKDLKQFTDAKALFTKYDALIEADATFKDKNGDLVPYKTTLHDASFMGELIEKAHKYKDIYEPAKKFLDLVPIDEYLGDDRKKNQKIIAGSYLVTQEYSKGDVQGALFQYVKMGEHIPALADLLEATKSARAIADFSGEVNTFIKNELKTGIDLSGIAEKKIANADHFNIMVDRGIGRFMAVWASLSDIDNEQTRFDKAKEIVKGEIDLGLDKGKGMFAATEIKSGGVRRGWTFHSLTKSQGLDEIDKNGIISLYTGEGIDQDSVESLVTSTDAKDQDESIRQVKSVLNKNLKNLMTVNDARNLLGLLATGKVDNNHHIPPNMKTFIQVTKAFGYQVTTRDIMNMTIQTIQENGDKIWKDNELEIDTQFERAEWPIGTEDLVKATCGVVPRHKKDEIGLTCKQLFKNQGLDINQTLIERWLELKGVK